MRQVENFNNDWLFTKPGCKVERLNLPHTWNGTDGQDGGNDYYRGVCTYAKAFIVPKTDDDVWIEFRGVASVAEVTLNGRVLFRHLGGYSAFRVNLTEALEPFNTITVTADNSFTRQVYPQRADFTFYGGIYRDVYLITVPMTHFSLGDYGSRGFRVTPGIEGNRAVVHLQAQTENAADGTPVVFCISGVGEDITQVKNGVAETFISIDNVRLWDGLNDPYLYTATARMGDDTITTQFGCRTFHVDPEHGFYLNGRSYPLCGVARHQDRPGVGSALTPAMHEEDLALILEMGANSVRLAHYQHDEYFYDLCDRAGLLVWAEIPYITEHMPEANANTHNQMTELVLQNVNHPSIFCWALSNEITVTGGVTDDLTANHRALNELVHKLDASRPTAMAHSFLQETDDPLVNLPDLSAFNLYYGWYVGDREYNSTWFDDFHSAYPATPVGLSEYGADANPAYQSPAPERGDWTESYQAVYHEYMLEMWAARPFIWCMFVWNMFDFAADGREEGGKPGQNQKGLVTFDRKTKKDAFYLYKAYLAKEPFIYLCGRRYAERMEAETEIKVYTNQPEVTLFVDGQPQETQRGGKVFRFRVLISSKHTIAVRAGVCVDEITFKKVDKPNPSYFAPGHQVVNWFDKPEIPRPDGFYSILDRMGDINRSPQAAALVAEIRAKSAGNYGDVAKNVKTSVSMQKLAEDMTVQAILKMSAKGLSPESISELNLRLNEIAKPKEAL
jgi:beta-galactosidase